MKFLVGLIICIFSVRGVHAQRVCGTEQFVRAYTIQQRGENANPVSARDTIPNEIINIPVVVHVLYNNASQNISDAQVLSQIAVLNKDYRGTNADRVNIPPAFRSLAADTRINFCLAKVTPTGHSFSGIIHKQTSVESFMSDAMKYSNAGGDDAWDSRRYLNIWVCNMFGRSLGFATMPGGDPAKDGVVINFDVFGTIGSLRPSFDKGRTATHEIGHWLGLKHLWGDDDCGSDDVDDTPPQRSYNFYCPSFPHTTVCSLNGNGDMFSNYMDFVDDACMNIFTIGQKNRMRGYFAANAVRNGFLNSYACDSSFATGGPLPVDTPRPEITVVPDNISIYPNPVQQLLNISTKELATLSGKTATIYTAEGRMVMQTVLKFNKEAMNVGHLPAGMYILVIGTGKEKKSFKLMKGGN